MANEADTPHAFQYGQLSDGLCWCLKARNNPIHLSDDIVDDRRVPFESAVAAPVPPAEEPPQGTYAQGLADAVRIAVPIAKCSCADLIVDALRRQLAKSSAATSAPQGDAEKVDRVHFNAVCEQRDDWIAWARSMLAKIGASTYQQSLPQSNLRSLLSAALRSHQDEAAIRRAAFDEAIAIVTNTWLRTSVGKVRIENQSEYERFKVISALEVARDTTPTDEEG